MQRLLISFQSVKNDLVGKLVTARGLYGLFFHVLNAFGQSEAEWLHAHPSPKPYSLAPYYAQDGALSGIRISSISQKADQAILQCWGQAYQSGKELRLGPQSFHISGIECIPGPSFTDLATREPQKGVQIEFLSPTAFRQEASSLPLPLPVNVFRGPFRVWNIYSPPALTLPGDWLRWCEREVFIKAYKIETSSTMISNRELFTGFVGKVLFETRSEVTEYLKIFQGLAQFAAFSGIGHKTAMGMGAIEVLSTD